MPIFGSILPRPHACLSMARTFRPSWWPFPCRHLEYLADVARLEWAMHTALHAEVRVPLDPAELGGLASHDVARLVLQFDPSVTLLDSPWPIDQIWRVNQVDAEVQAPVDLNAGGVSLE